MGQKSIIFFNPNSDLVAKPLHVSPYMAFKLWWKNVTFIQHSRYTNPEYRKEALIRDQILRSVQLLEAILNYLQVEGSDPRYHADEFKGIVGLHGEMLSGLGLE